MADHKTDEEPPASEENVPTVSCDRCGREWDLGYELEAMAVGNQAIEQFALDHQRHTGHFPDGLAVWQADCRHCPESVQRLEERGARRWAATHARHTNHDVTLVGDDGHETIVHAPE
ncbi:hypothetical protein Hrd1104_02915 [Halorhabdus sp. CBA1104]|uniref:hypothetical protein n=1 Tax=Halorhabdus sp. CBA1104 TaxID=1380432 RepID=UPI0012B3DD4A|nr:hypothetical protein [Halorhabdus sp. CBA1104]QGN06348.1 hypothetical protein Hrd1104_02915 [Halorhabdus sp. CBA1104]